MARTVLLPLAGFYEAALFFRNKAFDFHLLPVGHVGVPVIAVGNLTVGGTGKTPLVEFLVARLRNLGRRVAVVSRGYGRKSHGVRVVSDGHVLLSATDGGDEPVQIARKFPGSLVVVGERRADAAELAVRELGAEVILLDDGYQHRYLHRDLNILVLDASRDIREERPLPAGLRREPLCGIGRADLIAWADPRGGQTLTELGASIDRWFQGPMITFTRRPTGVFRASTWEPAGSCEGKHVLAFCGVANPDRFFQTVEGLGAVVVQRMAFPDHQWFRVPEIRRIIREFRRSHAELIITTEKDVVRILAGIDARENFLNRYPVVYPALAVQILAGEDGFLDIVRRIADRGRAS